MSDHDCACSNIPTLNIEVYAAWQAKAAAAQAEGKRFEAFSGSSDLILIEEAPDDDSQTGV
jgi:hypothetical protein